MLSCLTCPPSNELLTFWKHGPSIQELTTPPGLHSCQQQGHSARTALNSSFMSYLFIYLNFIYLLKVSACGSRSSVLLHTMEGCVTAAEMEEPETLKPIWGQGTAFLLEEIAN
ncbi:hypothetical protein CHARACLAT_021944 [Characodon lateralis]|uniref:Uncharacterized protein n=1 Tax=Characodon lateralis TaxID=208331 RepID=A0ABU7F5G6_9TELE|nr:hypothetical protein [Characodon lateralis]